jgi:hypothetical protein
MEQKLVFEDSNGKVVRTYQWDGSDGIVVRRGDTLRLEVLKDTSLLTKKKIPFENLGSLQKSSLSEAPFLVGELGHLRLIDSITDTLKNQTVEEESEKTWYATVGFVLMVALLLIGFMATRSLDPSEKMKEELKQEVVKIFKNRVPPPKVENRQMNKISETEPKVVPKQKSANTLKRMGALAALGSLSKSNQRGGLNLGAANTSAGPGLGGTEGSGGTQTSLYAKGIVSAPLGAGGNIQGAGGYGTKGKGGGKEGYGKLSLIGSAGDNPIPLGQEATIETGLDRDAIAAVINRNIGQVRFCYEQGLQGNPNLNGRIAVGFTIGGNGLVKTAGIDSTTMASKIVEDCITMRLKTWKFPLPQGGVDVKVSYPFVLRRAGQG